MRAGWLLAAAALLLAVPAVAAPETETEHVVQPGETLAGIAVRTKVPRVLIAEANGLRPPYTLRSGQRLKIPRTRRYTVKRGDTGFAVAYAYGVPWRDIAVANALDPDRALQPGEVLLIPTLIDAPQPSASRVASASAAAATATVAAANAAAINTPPRFARPLAGPVRRGFGGSDSHDGIDIIAPEGAAVRASAAGKVQFVGNEPRRLGNFVVIDHGNGWATAYAFLSRATVVEDEDVRAGERIGLVGSTGMAQGAELHFEVRQNNTPVDPAERLAAAAVSPAPRTSRPSPDRSPASSPRRPGANAARTASPPLPAARQPAARQTPERAPSARSARKPARPRE